MLLNDLMERLRYWGACDRIGPDVPLTHWRLYFRGSMAKLCRSKFEHFGEGAEIRPGVYAVGCSRISIGRRVVVRPGSVLIANPDGIEDSVGRIVIEDHVLLGAGIHAYTTHHAFGAADRPIMDQGDQRALDVRIGRGAWIGANSILMPGVSIGENAVVGAGSIVTRSVPTGAIFAGNPARPIVMSAAP